MDGRGVLLHGRHHTSLPPDKLIVDSSPDFEIRMQQPLEDVDSSSTNDSDGRLLLEPRVPDSPTSDEESCNEADRLGVTVDSGISSTFDAPRAWDETYRFRKRFGGLPTLDVLDIMRESARVLRRQSDLLTTLTAALIVPVSVVILTHVLITRPVIDWVEMRLEAAVFEQSGASILQIPYTKYIYTKLAGFIVTSVLCVPLAITLIALSKAGVVYTVASTYAGVKVSFLEVMHRVVPRVWLPLVITYTASCVVFLASAVAALLCVGISNGLFAALHPSLPEMLLVFTVIGLVFCGIFIYLKVILNLANVICILEDIYGFAAMIRSFHIVQSRLKVAVCSYLVTSLCGGFLTLLFEFRVTDKNDYTTYNSSGGWEGPLLVLMHSFMYLFDDIMVTVFYFTCPASLSFDDFDRTTGRVPEGVGSSDLTSL